MIDFSLIFFVIVALPELSSDLFFFFFFLFFCLTTQGSPYVSLSPHLLFIIGFICNLFVIRNDSWMR